MPEPSPETFRAIAANQGLSLTDERLAQAVETHAGLRPQLELLRAHRLSFLEPVLEPGTALAWIEGAGR